jgi:hypothetical protein
MPIFCRYDESIDAFTASDTGGALDMMELGRKVASERELLRSPSVRLENVVFDESSNFLLYVPVPPCHTCSLLRMPPARGLRRLTDGDGLLD